MWSSERHIWRARPLSSFKHVLVPTSSYRLVTSTWRWPTLFPRIFYYVWWLKKPSSDGVVNLYTKAQLRPSAGQRRYQSTSDGFGFSTLCYKWWFLFLGGAWGRGRRRCTDMERAGYPHKSSHHFYLWLKDSLGDLTKKDECPTKRW